MVSTDSYASAGLALDSGEWRAAFDETGSRVECTHAASGAVANGVIEFKANVDGVWTAWSIALPRDSVQNRLAMLDAEGNVQGYVTFVGTGGTLRIGAIHRTAQSYEGVLTFQGTVRLGGPAFACRTQPLTGGRVVQMASGPISSALNDSLFDLATDTVLRFGGAHVAIQPDAAEFSVEIAADIRAAAHSALVFEIERGYYKNRYVPHYIPIDKARCPSAPTGWMSWNTYFDTAGEKENLDEARIGAAQLKPFGMEIWSIESWQDNSPTLPVSKFHNLTLRPDPHKFPNGMKWLADRIRELGFRPGIWTVPFGTGDAAFYEAHKDWFLHDAEGKPMSNWSGLYLLDPSQEAVRRHMEETHRTMSREWGYEYFKIDGMSGRGPGYSAHFYERPEVRAAFKEPCGDPFRLCVEALRRGIGPDRIWLACQGHYTGPEIGLADAGRIGADIVHPNRPPLWDNYRNQAWATLNQLFVNNIAWYCDPDTLLVGEPASMDMVRLATAVVGLPGQVMFAGDRLAALPPERMRLLQQCLPVCDVRPLDLFPIFEMLPVWDLKVARPFGSWDVVSLFNWGDEPAQVGVRFDELGLPGDAEYLVYDFWNGRLLGRFRDEIQLEAAPRSNRLLSVHPFLGRPQFLSTDRHITQGAIGLDALAWDDAAKVLSGQAPLVADVPQTLAFFIPDGFTLDSVEGDGADVIEALPAAGNLLTLRLQRSTFGPAVWRLAFAAPK